MDVDVSVYCYMHGSGFASLREQQHLLFVCGNSLFNYLIRSTTLFELNQRKKLQIQKCSEYVRERENEYNRTECIECVYYYIFDNNAVLLIIWCCNKESFLARRRGLDWNPPFQRDGMVWRVVYMCCLCVNNIFQQGMLQFYLWSRYGKI